VTPARSLHWVAPGDLTAFFGLALDNMTQLVILSSLLVGVFQFPADLVANRALGSVCPLLAWRCFLGVH